MKLLSIDGGGIKALYSAIVIDYIEQHYDVRIIDHIDVISGTSAGGIIALGLAAGRRPREIVDFLLEHGPLIFPPNPLTRILRTLWSVCFSMYGNSELEKACKTFFGEDLTIEDIADRLKGTGNKLCVCIPSVNYLTGKAKVFKTPHHKNLHLDKDYFVWQVALATAAAPYYLPVAKITKGNVNEYYVDGGLWGNNPSVVALTEALTYSAGDNTPSSFDLLSIGNIPDGLGKTPHILRRGLSLWNKNLVLLPLGCQSEATHNMIKLLFEKNRWNYIRIEHSNFNVPNVGFDKTNKKSLNLLHQLAKDDISKFTSTGSLGDNKLRTFFNIGR